MISKKSFDRACLFVFVGGSLILGATAASAQSVSTDLDQMKTEATKISQVYSTVAPTAVAAITFGAGAKVLKRVIYS